MPNSAEHITQRLDLRIGVQPVWVARKDQSPGTPQEYSIRAYSNIDPVEFAPALRGWSHVFQPANGEVLNSMLVRGDGLIERVFVDLAMLASKPGQGRFGVRFVDVVAFALSVVTSIEVFRTRTGTSEVPYEVELDLVANPNKLLMLPDSDYRHENYQFITGRTILPRLLIGDREGFKAVSDTIQIDLMNAAQATATVYFELLAARSLGLHDHGH
jgi:hypothetical protein